MSAGLTVRAFLIAAQELVMHEACRAAKLVAVKLSCFYLTFLAEEVKKPCCFEYIVLAFSVVAE